MTEKADKPASIMGSKCLQCGKVLGPEVFLGAVCGKCCRENHRKVTGKRKEKS